jgi:uncharacterized protein (TIGR03437 family)
LANFRTPSGYSGVISAIVSQVRAAGVSGVPLGAGVGTWLRDGVTFIENLANAGIDYIDLHIYPVNFGFLLPNLIDFTNRAQALGKRVAISEAWLLKERDSEFQMINVASDPAIFARDAFSFWAPLDQKFLTSLVKFSHWKNLQYLSAFWSKYFWAYIDYSQVQNMDGAQITARSTEAAAAALQAGQITNTATAYKNAITAAAAQLSTVSAASFSRNTLAPDSIVSIYGSGLATSTAAALALPLPTSLAGTIVAVTDSDNNRQTAALLFVSPGQVNAVIPSGLRAGPATVAVTNSAGTVMQSTVTLAGVAPGLFSQNSNGRGIAAAAWVKQAADGSRTFDLVAQCGATPGSCTPKPFDLGGPTDQVALLLFGTGIRGRSALSAVSVTIGGVGAPVFFAGPQGEYVGLDQINALLPKSLAGQGEVSVSAIVDGVTTNTVTVSIR